MHYPVSLHGEFAFSLLCEPRSLHSTMGENTDDSRSICEAACRSHDSVSYDRFACTFAPKGEAVTMSEEGAV